MAFPNPVRYNKGLKPPVRQAKMYLVLSGIAIDLIILEGQTQYSIFQKIV